MGNSRSCVVISETTTERDSIKTADIAATFEPPAALEKSSTSLAADPLQPEKTVTPPADPLADGLFDDTPTRIQEQVQDVVQVEHDEHVVATPEIIKQQSKEEFENALDAALFAEPTPPSPLPPPAAVDQDHIQPEPAQPDPIQPHPIQPVLQQPMFEESDVTKLEASITDDVQQVQPAADLFGDGEGAKKEQVDLFGDAEGLGKQQGGLFGEDEDRAEVGATQVAETAAVVLAEEEKVEISHEQVRVGLAGRFGLWLVCDWGLGFG